MPKSLNSNTVTATPDFWNRGWPRNGLRCCFVLFTLTIIGLLCLMLPQKISVETDLMALMPRDASKPLEEAAADALLKAGGDKVLLVLKGKPIAQAQQSAIAIKKLALDSGLFTAMDDELSASKGEELIELLASYRFGLMSAQDRERLQQGQISQLQTQAQMELFDFSESAGQMLPIYDDPVGLFGRWFSQQYIPRVNVYPRDGVLMLENGDEQAVIVALRLKAEPFSISTHESLAQLEQTIYKQLPNDVELLRSGVVFFAAEAAVRSKREVALVSIGSIIGIVLLFLLVFVSPLPMVMSLLSIAFGSASAFVLVHAIYGQVHLLTLVFGASLIGVAIDYSLHFFVLLYRQGSHLSAWQAMQNILPEISLGLFTTMVAYACLWQSSLPGLRQIASFSAIGLFASWLFVVVVFPQMFSFRTPRSQPRLEAVVSFPSVLWQRFGGALSAKIFALFILLSIVVLSQMQWSNDVRSLHVPSAKLLGEERQVQSLLQRSAVNQFYLVSADSEQSLLEAEEALAVNLSELVATGGLKSFEAVSQYLPSFKRQAQNYRLLHDSFYKDDAAEQFMTDLGVDAEHIVTHLQDEQTAQARYLSPTQWLPLAGIQTQFLWLGKLEGRHASLISLQGISDIAGLRAAADAHEAVKFVDRIDSLSEGLHQQRSQAGWLLALAYGAVALLLWLRRRQLASLALVGVPLLSSLLTLAMLTLAGVSISLFHIFGLFLVFGLGMDYGIFLMASDERHNTCLIAITLSALTSCLAFGLLSFSSTPMIQAFGITVLLGSLLNLLLVPAITLLPRGQANA